MALGICLLTTQLRLPVHLFVPMHRNLNFGVLICKLNSIPCISLAQLGRQCLIQYHSKNLPSQMRLN